MTPECATEQLEHSWAGTRELLVWTWTAWTIPTKPIRSMPRQARSLRLRFCHELAFVSKLDDPRRWNLDWLDMRCRAQRPGLPVAYNPKSSRRRLVWARLTGISVCFLSSIRS